MKLWDRIRADWGVVARNLVPTKSRIKGTGARRLDSLSDLLVLEGSPEAQELYLMELFSRTARQIGAHLHLGPTFLKRVDAMDADLRKALPSAFHAFVRVVREKPVRMADARMLAHALSVDGQTAAHLRELSDWRRVLDVPDGGLEQAKAAYRRLRRAHHPDTGGDADTFHRVQTAWTEAQQELS